jgi:hypothetical protein
MVEKDVFASMWCAEEAMKKFFLYFNVQDMLKHLLSGRMVDNGSSSSSYIFLLFMTSKWLGNEVNKEI